MRARQAPFGRFVTLMVSSQAPQRDQLKQRRSAMNVTALVAGHERG
jgi:hypothetical protein